MADLTNILSTGGGLVGGPIGAGIGSLLGAGIGLLTGHKQKKQGNNLLNTPYPTMPIPDEITQQANQGIPSEQYAQAQRNIQRNQMLAIQGMHKYRSSDPSKIQQSTNDADLNLDTLNAKTRMEGQRRLADFKTKKWGWDVQNKYNRDYSYGMNLLGAGNQNFTGGLDKLGAGIGLLAGGGAFNGMFKKSNTHTATDYSPV